MQTPLAKLLPSNWTRAPLIRLCLHLGVDCLILMLLPPLQDDFCWSCIFVIRSLCNTPMILQVRTTVDSRLHVHLSWQKLDTKTC